MVFILASVLIGYAHQQAICMNCVYSDNNAGFLDSYSYCEVLDVCL